MRLVEILLLRLTESVCLGHNAWSTMSSSSMDEAVRVYISALRFCMCHGLYTREKPESGQAGLFRDTVEIPVHYLQYIHFSNGAT